MQNKVPYPPSWIDRFTRWLDRVPGPKWLYFLIVAVIFTLIHAFLNWQAGTYPPGTFFPFHVWFMAELVYVVAFIRYLDRFTAGALERFRPALKVSEDEYADLHYRLTHLPARRTLLISLPLGILVVVFALTSSPEAFSPLQIMPTAALRIINSLLFGLTWFLFGTLYYHAFHQLSLISRSYAEQAHIDLLSLTPLYNFSSVTARTAVGLVGMNLMWTFTESSLFDPVTNLTASLPYLVVALVIFVWPLWGIHRRIQIEKQRALDANGQRWQSIATAFHRDVDANVLDNSGKYRDFLTSLDLERGVLKKIPTWPWQPDTLRGFLSALALPIVIFLIQYVIRLALDSGK